MGVHLEKLCEVVSWVFEVKRVSKWSKAIVEGLVIERCNHQMKVDLKEIKENSKFESSWKCTKKSI
jgi:hypothetical protein